MSGYDEIEKFCNDLQHSASLKMGKEIEYGWWGNPWVWVIRFERMVPDDLQ